MRADVGALDVDVRIPLEQLKWIELPSQTNAAGAKARILYRDQFQRPARVAKLLKEQQDIQSSLEKDDPGQEDLDRLANA